MTPAALAATPFLLARLPDHPTMVESLEYQVVGLVIVLAALAALWAACAIVGALFRAAGSERLEKKVESAAGAQATPPEITAVIAAAIHATLDGRHRVLSIHLADTHAVESRIHAWSMEGRRHVFASHKIR